MPKRSHCCVALNMCLNIAMNVPIDVALNVVLNVYSNIPRHAVITIGLTIATTKL